MKRASILILAGAVIAGAGALAYKVYKEKKAEKKASTDEPVVTVEEEDVVSEDIPDDVLEDADEPPEEE